MSLEPSQQTATEKATDSGQIELSDLLVLTGLIAKENFESCLSLSTKMKVPVERVLAMHAHLSEAFVRKAIAILEHINSEQMSLEQGAQVLRAFDQDQELAIQEEQKQLSLHWSHKKQPILELLKKIGAITDRQQQFTQQMSADTGLPGGCILFGQGAVTDSLLTATIFCQRTIDNNTFSQEQALSYLRLARLNQLSYQEVLQKEGITLQPLQSALLRGQLLLDAEIVNSFELLACSELACLLHLEIEQLIWHFGHLERQGYESLLELYDQMVQGLSIDEALAAMRSLKPSRRHTSAKAVDQSLTGDSGHADTLDLLRESGVLSKGELMVAAETAFVSRKPLLKVLLEDNLITEGLVSDVLDCQRFLNEGLISRQQALLLVAYCAETECKMAAALQDFGWHGSRLMQVTPR
jgi:hypothetical protein